MSQINLIKLFNACIGFLPASPIFILFFKDITGSIAAASALFAWSFIAAGIADLPAGAFSDRVGRKTAAIIGTSSILLCLIVYASATNWQTLFLAATLDGIGMALWSGNANALLYDTLREQGRLDELAKQMGRANGCQHWSAAVAALVGAGLATIDFRYTLWACVPTHVAAVVITCLYKEPARTTTTVEPLRGHFTETVRVMATNRSLSVLALAAMLSTGICMTASALRSTWSITLWPLWAVGVARSASAVLSAVGMRWANVVIERYGARPALVRTQLLCSTANIAALAVPTVASPAVMTCSSLAFGIGGTAEQSLLQAQFTDAQRATLSSLVAVGGRIVMGVCTIGLGFVADAVSPGIALLVCEVGLVAALPLYALSGGWRLRRTRSGAQGKAVLS